jgi:hypothetical protein
VREGARNYLRWWQERPSFSRAYLIEVPTAGPAAVEQRALASQRFEGLFDALAVRAREEEPDLPPPLQLGTSLIIVGIIELVAQEVRAGRIDTLEDRAPDVAALIETLIAARA